MQGADVAALRDLSARLDDCAHELELMTSKLSSRIQTTMWLGPDADRLKAEWSGFLTPALSDCATGLGSAAKLLRRNADAQERASQGEGADDEGAMPFRRGIGMLDVFPTNREEAGQGNPDGDPATDGRLGDYEKIGQVALDDEDLSLEEVNQGALADCWLLASAAAVASQDPDFIRDHLRYDATTNSYTVTLYEKGKAVDVTVDASVITEGARDSSENASWLSVYEKAAAEFMGGHYEDIEYDSPARGLELVTGQEVISIGTDPTWFWQERPSLSSIGDHVGSGQPVVAATRDPGGWSGSPVADDVVGNHVYIVQAVSPDGESITLINPWGEGEGDKYGSITLTADEFYADFTDVYRTPSTRN